MHRTSRRLIQDFCHSVLNIPISLGAVQNVIDRASDAILPHYEAIAVLARQATVGYIDETSWYCQNALQWLWTLTTDTVSLYLIHPHRCKDAFAALIKDWQGIWVSDGYGVYQNWVHYRQTCLAHHIRTARGLSEKRDPDGARRLRDLGPQGVAALVPHGQSPAQRGRVEGLVCPVLSLDRPLP
jgi:transposase